MVMTVLEAQVAEDKWELLRQTYNQEIRTLDAGINQTFLLQDARNRTQWRIATVWDTREALDAMRASGQTPRGVVIFRAAGAEPTLNVYEVASATSA